MTTEINEISDNETGCSFDQADVFHDVFHGVGNFVASLNEQHALDLCHNCTMETILSYCIMDMRARGKHLEGIIDKVNEEFVNWDAAIRETEEAA